MLFKCILATLLTTANFVAASQNREKIVLIEDDFTSNQNDWYVDNRNLFSEWKFDKGILHIWSSQVGQLLKNIHIPTSSDFDISARIAIYYFKVYPSAGIKISGSHEIRFEYRMIYKSGVKVLEYKNGQFLTRIEKRRKNKLLFNKMRISKRGDLVSFYMNEKLIGELAYPNLEVYHIGFILEGRMGMRIDEFSVYEYPKE